jgi:putative phosphoribosyl transferase
MLFACPVRLFRDRRDAGRRLARALGHLRGFDVVVVGLPRGGVPVADEVARALDAPLDVVLVRKLGAPFQREYAIGAIGEDGALFVNERALALLGLSRDELMRIALRERVELERLSGLYRGEREPLPVEGRTVILVDDGIATGLSARAAARAVRARGARRIVLAVPVAPPDQRDRFMGVVDEFVCLEQPEGFVAVGAYYEEFGATSDEEVEACLRHAREQMQALDDSAAGDDPPPRVGRGLDLARVARDQVRIGAAGVELTGDLQAPPAARGLVIFAHGSGSSRRSPRNLVVASRLHKAGLATLLFDLLTDDETRDRSNVFDIDLLAARLAGATGWAQSDPAVAGLPIGYFGASTGAAAALVAAAKLQGAIAAVVSRGGRPDLAGDCLREVTAPTLLIVGAADHEVLELNRRAAARLRCPHRLALIPGATQLFEEEGALEQVARLAAGWLCDHLPAHSAGASSDGT